MVILTEASPQCLLCGRYSINIMNKRHQRSQEGTHDFNTMLAFFFNMQSNMSLYFILILYTAQILSVLHLLKIKLQCNKNRLTNE